MYRVIKLLVVVLLLVVGYTAVTRGWTVWTRGTEVLRRTGDDGLQAVVYELNPSGLDELVYRVFVSEANESVAEREPVAVLYGAIRSDDAWGVGVEWGKEAVLVISCLRASSIVVPRRRVLVDGRVVEIVVRRGVEDADAEPGPMAPGFALNRWIRRVVS